MTKHLFTGVRAWGTLLGLLLCCLCVVSFSGRASAANAPAAGLAPALAGQRMLWLGDSITQDGKYVTFAEYYLDRIFPDRSFDFISIGLASETVSSLSEKDHPFPRPDVHERLQRALDRVKPAVVVACYGMNDGIYHPQSPERMKAFQDGIRTVSETVRRSGARLILLTPPPFDPQPVSSVRKADAPDFSYKAPFEGYDAVLADYARWEPTLAHPPDVTVIDLHTPLSAYLKLRREADPAYQFSKDGIHPDVVGHLLMARTILQSLGVALPPAPDLEAELRRITADPVFTLVERHRRTRSDGWLAYVGYTRGQTVRADSAEPAETAASALQRQIDAARAR